MDILLDKMRRKSRPNKKQRLQRQNVREKKTQEILRRTYVHKKKYEQESQGRREDRSRERYRAGQTVAPKTCRKAYGSARVEIQYLTQKRGKLEARAAV